MADGIEVDGADTFRRTMGDLERNLDDLGPAHDKAGQRLLDLAGPRTPRLSGQLASSGRVDADADETTVSYTEVYAGVIHDGWADRNIEAQPWLAETAESSTQPLVDVFVDHLDDLVGHVRGT
jgi:hypothetical protein